MSDAVKSRMRCPRSSVPLRSSAAERAAVWPAECSRCAGGAAAKWAVGSAAGPRRGEPPRLRARRGGGGDTLYGPLGDVATAALCSAPAAAAAAAAAVAAAAAAAEAALLPALMSPSSPNPSRCGLDCDSFSASLRSPWEALPPARAAPPPTAPRSELSVARACCCGARWPEPPSSRTGAETEEESAAAAAAVAAAVPPPLPARNRRARGWRSSRLLPARTDGLAARGGAAAAGSRP